MSKEIIKILKSDPNLKLYQELENKINQDPIIKEEINKIKALQKELVIAQSLGDISKANRLNNEYQERLKTFLDKPLFQEYFDLQAYYNDILTFIKETLTNQINQELNNWKRLYITVFLLKNYFYDCIFIIIILLCIYIKKQRRYFNG